MEGAGPREHAPWSCRCPVAGVGGDRFGPWFPNPGCRPLRRELWLHSASRPCILALGQALSQAVRLGEPTASSEARQEPVFEVNDSGSNLIIR